MQYYSGKDFGIAGKTKDAFPATVVGSAYDTSGNGGRKLVRLSNGWLVVGVINGISYWFYKSTDNGATWTKMAFQAQTNTGGSTSLALASVGTTVYCIINFYTSSTDQRIRCWKIDAIAETGSGVDFDTLQTAAGTVSLCIDGTGALHAAWASKNATYPNSFNIRYSKSTDGGATWATPTQLTTSNTAGVDLTNPCIVVRSNNMPSIIMQFNKTISVYNWNGSSWGSRVDIFGGGTYDQSNPCAAVDSLDNIHVVWHGLDATDTTSNNIRYSKSTDGGATWSAMLKLTSGNSYVQRNASIAIDANNKLYVLFEGVDSAITTTYSQVRKVEYNGSAWTQAISMTNNTTNSITYPNSLWSKFNMNSADAIRFIYQDLQATAVKYDTDQRFKVPDLAPSIVETYIPLCCSDGASVTGSATSSGSSFLTDGSGFLSVANTDSRAKLFTLSSNWDASKLFALEVTINANTSGVTIYIALWDMTTNTQIRQIGSAATTATVLRSSQFTLVPGHVYGVSGWTAGTGSILLADASLVVFG